MSSLDQDILSLDLQDAIDVIQRHSSDPRYHTGVEYQYYENLASQPPSVRAGVPCYPLNSIPDVPGPLYDWSEPPSWAQAVPEVPYSSSAVLEPPQVYSVFPPQRNGKGRKKLRLYEYLHEALHDINMADSIQWADRSSGTFHFVSKNKEKLAECWGKRKGNRKTMTYQKMARALRNYSRTGEIVKIRRKLTYQFNPVILQRLGSGHTPFHGQRETLPQMGVPADQTYYGTPRDWSSWYGHFPCDTDYDLAFALTSASTSKV